MRCPHLLLRYVRALLPCAVGGYQAYLLLSRPGVDFRGGAFYIIDPAAAAAARSKGTGGGEGGGRSSKDDDDDDDGGGTRVVDWASSGDLVVFAANSKEAGTPQSGPRNWLHGFREVRAGSTGASECHLCVVGLLE